MLGKGEKNFGNNGIIFWINLDENWKVKIEKWNRRMKIENWNRRMIIYPIFANQKQNILAKELLNIISLVPVDDDY